MPAVSAMKRPAGSRRKGGPSGYVLLQRKLIVVEKELAAARRSVTMSKKAEANAQKQLEAASKKIQKEAEEHKETRQREIEHLDNLFSARAESERIVKGAMQQDADAQARIQDLQKQLAVAQERERVAQQEAEMAKAEAASYKGAISSPPKYIDGSHPV